MNNKKYNRLKQRLLTAFVPFIVGFCLIIILEIFLVQNGKIPWFIVREAVKQQYLFKTSGTDISYFYVSQEKKSITQKDILAITELVHKRFFELSEIFKAIPEFTLFTSVSKNGTQGVLVMTKLSTENTHNGISCETARMQWIGFVKKQISRVIGSELTDEK